MALTADLLEGIEHLDPLPITAQRLVKALDDERIGPAQIADYIEYDPAVASSVLRLANSAAWLEVCRRPPCATPSSGLVPPGSSTLSWAITCAASRCAHRCTTLPRTRF